MYTFISKVHLGTMTSNALLGPNKELYHQMKELHQRPTMWVGGPPVLWPTSSRFSPTQWKLWRKWRPILWMLEWGSAWIRWKWLVVQWVALWASPSREHKVRFTLKIDFRFLNLRSKQWNYCLRFSSTLLEKCLRFQKSATWPLGLSPCPSGWPSCLHNVSMFSLWRISSSWKNTNAFKKKNAILSSVYDSSINLPSFKH